MSKSIEKYDWNEDLASVLKPANIAFPESDAVVRQITSNQSTIAGKLPVKVG